MASLAQSLYEDEECEIYLGAHADDSAGNAYADCSKEFTDTIGKAINIGTYELVHSECLSMATGSKSVYVNIKADHACVSARGAKSDGFTDVTNLTGLFRTNSDLRKEVEMKVK